MPDLFGHDTPQETIVEIRPTQRDTNRATVRVGLPKGAGGRRKPRVVILRMRDVFAMDATGLRALEEVHERFRRQGIVMLLSGVRSQPMMVLVKSGALERFGEANVLGSFREASVRAWAVADETVPRDDGSKGSVPRV